MEADGAAAAAAALRSSMDQPFSLTSNNTAESWSYTGAGSTGHWSLNATESVSYAARSASSGQWSMPWSVLGQQQQQQTLLSSYGELQSLPNTDSSQYSDVLTAGLAEPTALHSLQPARLHCLGTAGYGAAATAECLTFSDTAAAWYTATPSTPVHWNNNNNNSVSASAVPENTAPPAPIPAFVTSASYDGTMIRVITFS